MSKSSKLFKRAQQIIPGGVNSPVRAFQGVSGEPVFFQRGEGPYLIDVDGNRYIDYVGSWGPLILGHAHPVVQEAVLHTVRNGLSFGAPTELEILLAEQIRELMPNLEMVRMVNSGTEATMTAIRVARAVTGRSKIIKFSGCYHGHSDGLLVKSGSGVLTLNLPSSPGIPAECVQATLVADFNDLASVARLFDTYADDIAAVIIEPVAGNMNFVPATPEFLSGLRALCTKKQALLIFDEVMSGFRVALGGAQQHYGIKPDLTTLGKVVGGGMPVGALGGSRAIMEYLAPVGDVYQAGTLSGNPVAMAAGLATLQMLSKSGFYEALSRNTEQLMSGLLTAAQVCDIPFIVNHLGSMFGYFFSKDTDVITTFQQVQACDIDLFKRFFHGMLAKGIYLAPSAFEAGFMSSAHQSEQLDETISAAQTVFQQLK